LAYSIAQQYWGSRLSESSDYPNWLTQGFSFYVASLYMQKQKIIFKAGNQAQAAYVKIASQGWNTSLNTPLWQLNRLPFDSFAVLAQGKGYTVIRMLDFILGRRIIEKTEQQLHNHYAYKEINASVLQQAIQEVSGKDMDWFFRQWQEESWTLDYGVHSLQVKQEEGKYKVVVIVQRLGSIIMPVSISLTLKNGAHVFKQWNGEKQTAHLQFEVLDDVQSVQLDPASVLPDIDRSNNKIENVVK
jgi:hypothetical protein